MSESKQTIYINNLNEKVTINKLKKELNKVFEPCGEILQISAFKTLKLKGQAFITFNDTQSAAKAIELQNKEVFSKPMNITFAKYNSDIAESDEVVLSRKKSKKRKLDDKKSDTKVNKKLRNEWKDLPPNNILLIQNLTSTDGLESFFGKYTGFENIRLVKVKNLAFINFEDEKLSKNCLDAVSDEELKQFGNDVIFSFAKK
ncbi:U1A U1 small nuclear ribonucleoprotein A [Candida maltosa Xu316]